MRTIRIALTQQLTYYSALKLEAMLRQVEKSQHVEIVLVSPHVEHDVLYDPLTKESWYVSSTD